MLNQRGQEFSVFKLLISAIVAIVVLTLLLNILGIVDFNPNTDPANAAENLLTSMDSSVYQEKVTARLDFTSENSINTAALAEATGLDREQICLLVEDDLSEFSSGTTANLINYTGSGTVRVKLAGICADQTDFADADFFDSYAPKLATKTFEDIPSTCNFATGQKACLLVLIKSDE